MAFKGTSRRKPGRVEEEVKSYGGVINASTGIDSVNYTITVPKEHAGGALDLMEDIIFNPTFDENELKKERGVILKEIKLNRDDPARRVMRQLWESSYVEHPYKMPVIGYEDLFKGLKRDDLMNYHSLRYTPDNLVLTVAGDVDKDAIIARIKPLFEKHPRARNSRAAVPAERRQNSLRELRGFANINLGYLAMGYHTVELSGNDLYALDVLGIILGEWDGSRLNKRLVKDDELLYTVSSFNYTPKYPGLLIIYGIGDSGNMDKARAAILEEIEKIKARGPEEGELEAAKSMVISGYINSLETTGGLAAAVSQGEFLAGDPAFLDNYVGNVKKVDMESVRRAAQKYLEENNLTVSYLLPRAETVSSAGSVVPGGRQSPPERHVLANGIRLILKEDRRLPKTSVVSAFLGGVRVETDETNGISNLTSAMLLNGTKTRKEDEILPFLESRGGAISAFSGKNSFGVSLSFLSKDTHDALDVLEDVIENSVFPEEELRKEKEKIYAAIKSQDDDVYDTGFLKLRKALFGDYPYGLRVLGEADSLKGITRKAVKNFYKKYCASGNMVIAACGDFDLREMREKIEKRFSDMNPALARKGGVKKASPDIKVASPAALRGTKEVDCGMEREQSLVIAGFRGTTFKNRDRYSLRILSSVLSGENGRLYQTIRNELGLSYALGTFSAPGIDTGYIASFVATDKKHLNKAKSALLKELNAIKSGSISEKEVNLAKSSLIGREKIRLETSGALAYRMALDELLGAGYDAYRDYPERIRAVTSADVAEAAKKYIDLENSVIATVFGEEND